MHENLPLVTVGLAVYNGENFIREAIDSILGQTFRDFELIITDNASTDSTQRICEAYAAQDARVRYVRNPENLGCTQNQNYTVKLARGKYFKLAAHDDVCAPTMLEKCVGVLEREPDVVVCFPQAQVIDNTGKPLEKGIGKNDELYVGMTNANVHLRVDSPKAAERFGDLACFPHSGHHLFGVIRLDALRRTPLMGTYAGTDLVLLARLSLLGRFHEVPEKLFFLRRHEAQSLSINAISSILLSIWYDESRRGRLNFPRWERFWRYAAAVQETQLSLGDRLACYGQLIRLFRVSWKELAKDLAVASLQLLDKLNSNLVRTQIVEIYEGRREELLLGRIPRLQ
ncbi:MAG: glycosyltransferase family 2 protein [Synechococcales cyanobacterium CRU_2_2]|nr:glycosyltransferase family 2 protein [Synechococcales cyanobacterium CRU_2_2]